MSATAERLAGALSDRYRIEREIGQGGMATVYLAEDIRHHRRVAIKVLHAELSAVIGPERFVKEIELTANLQHPHILPLFDSGAADGLLYYVMPFVEGETLRGRLDRERQLPIADAIRIATDVADAIDYAHKRHVIHRDIKPENILLHDGRPLVADFGIALAVEQAAGSRMTQTGMSLGTPNYMAPEQAMGDKAVDHRADIYSLGAVVFEMLAGEPPFTGPTPQAIVAKVMTEKPRSLTSLRDTISPQMAAAVSSALQKLPADRPATAMDFAHGLTQPSLAPAFQFEPSRRVGPAAIAGGALVTAALFGIAGYSLGYKAHGSQGGSAPPSRLAMLIPNLGGTGVAALHRQIAMTPDGSAVVYVAQGGEANNTLAYQRLDSESPVPLEGSQGMLDPEIAPDGRTIFGLSYVIGGISSNVRIPIAGGTPSTMSNEINSLHTQLAPDGSVWYSENYSRGLRRIRPGGGASVAVGDSTLGLRLAQVLPGGGKAIMLRAPLGTAAGPAVVLDTRSGAITPLTDAQVVEMRYGAGHVAYARTDGTLWAAPFDEKNGRMTAPAVQIGSGVALTGTGIAQFSMAPNGNLAYIPEEPRWLVFVERDGRMRSVTTERKNFHAPKFSPDGSRIAVDFSGTDGRDVWILSLTRGTMSRATFDKDGHDATWTRDGQFITYTSFRNGPLGIYRTRPGGGKPDSILTESHLGYTGDWLRDATKLVTTATDMQPRSGSDIAIIQNAGRGPLTPLIVNQFQTSYPSVSPDGKWLAFVSDQSGDQEVYVRPLQEDGDDVQVSQSGGTEPVWSPDGRELFYRGITEGNVNLVSATIRTSPSFDVVSRRTLFSVADMAPAVPHANYDVSPDGQRFVLVRRSPATRLTVIQNLPALVKAIREAGSPKP
ncbi:MAG: protein kinase [Gemmatimonadales bacterium]